MSENLIAYIPTLNQRHIDWLKSHPGSDLYLISQEDAEALLPRLKRNMAALPTEMIARFLEQEKAALGLRRVWIFAPEWQEPDLRSVVWKRWVAADEDISHLVAEKHLLPAGCDVSFEMTWARYDMQAVLARQEPIPDAEITSDELALVILKDLQTLSERSPDWWRRVAAAAVNRQGRKLAVAYNMHMPNEYETYAFGDPAINREAGQTGKSCACHAEMGVIAECARQGYVLDGGKIYVTTFPCEVCAGIIARAGVKEVYFLEGYSSLNALDVFRTSKVKLIQVKEAPASAA